MPKLEEDFEKSEEQLFLELGDALVASGDIRLSRPLDDDEKRERAKRWFQSMLSKLRESICKDPRVRAYLHDKAKQNQVDIAGVVVDCLTAAGIGVAVGTLAILIVKGRLETLCA